MPKLFALVFGLLATGFVALPLRAQDSSVDNPWKPESIPNRPGSDFWVRPAAARAFSLDVPAARRLLGAAPLETPIGPRSSTAIISLPMPDGTLARFRFVDSPIMEPELAARFPQIKTFLGQGIDDPSASVRFDLTPAGFHAQILSPRGAVYIEPSLRGNSALHVSFFKRDYQRATAFNCLTSGTLETTSGFNAGPFLASSGNLRTYRLACAATGEYTQYFGGQVADGMAAIVTAINRVTGVYETELAIRLVLVANNDRLVYTNANSDPYNNNNGSIMLNQNQNNLDNVIGSANYDIGHVFSTGGGGVAGLGVVCVSGRKANGVTGLTDPVGDGFYIDYVTHEMGHQFGADHTFNSTSGSCGGGNRAASSAYEPGSGSTIMSYAGICGADDLQPHSDPYFHSASLDQILNYIITGSGNSCGLSTSSGNTAPSVNAGPNFTIPKGTPFQLTATGSDPDGETLSFCWEERDLGPATSLVAPDNGSSPLFRSFLPSLSSTRLFPKLSDLLNHTTTLGEMLPATSRLLRFRVVARDNRPGAGGINSADMQVTVTTNAGPFLVTSPNTAVTWSGARVVSWNVAGTANSPVNASNVDLLLSTNGGLSFPIVLASNVPNDGTQAVVLPNLTSSTARIKVQAVGNIFFDISDVDFSIIPDIPAPLISLESAALIEENCVPPNGTIDPGEEVMIGFALKNIGTSNTVDVVATLLPENGIVTPSEPQDYGALTVGGTSVTRSFTFTAAGACGGTVTAVLQLAEGTNSLGWITNSFGLGTFISLTNGSTNLSHLDIPGSGTKGDASLFPSPISISSITGIVTRVSVTLTGLTHSASSDLDVLLVGPTGQKVLLMSDAGSGSINSANLTFDDGGPALPSSGSIVSGTYKPTNFDTNTDTFSAGAPAGPYGQILSLFNGLDPNGTWSLYVEDDAGQAVGTLEGWSLSVVAVYPTCCTPVTLVNHAPILLPLPDQTVMEGNTLILTNSASDSDVPAQTLVFGLNNAPLGATLNTNTGVLTWTPSESQGPGSYVMAVRVSDDGLPSMSATQMLTINVLESNQSPVLAAIADQIIHAGLTLVVSNSATDLDLPANALTFGLAPGAPAATSIESDSGVFSWSTTRSDVNTTNVVTVRVTDDGVPSLSDEKRFLITVVPPPVIESVVLSNETVTVRWNTVAGRRYRLQAAGELGPTNWLDVSGDILAEGPKAEVVEPVLGPERFYRVRCLP